MTDAELFMAMRASFKEAEKFVEAAADRLETQAAEIERQVREKRWIMNERDRTFALVLARAEMAEAKLAKAVEAGQTMDDGCDCDRCSKARATLAEIKGESHE